MKIIFVITGLGIGGAERQVVDLADKLLELGHCVKIIYLVGGVKVRPNSSDIEIIGLNVKKNPLSILNGIFSLARKLREINPDVVHSHMIHANFLSRLSRLIYPIPRLICTAHSSNEGGWFKMLAYRMTHRLADVSTNVSAEAVKAFERMHAVPKGGMLAVLNGIDSEKFKQNVDERANLRCTMHWDESRIFLAVGRLVEAKDYKNLIFAYAKIEKKFPSARLCIVGDGPLRDEIQSLINNLGLMRGVQLLGFRSDIPSLMNAADYFVLSSAWEGFGLVVAEAMATKKIVIATDCGGVAEVLGGHGILVKPKDSQMLANAMCEALLLDNVKAQNMGRAARARVVEHYSINSVVHEWISIYSQGYSAK